MYISTIKAEAPTPRKVKPSNTHSEHTAATDWGDDAILFEAIDRSNRDADSKDQRREPPARNPQDDAETPVVTVDIRA